MSTYSSLSQDNRFWIPRFKLSQATHWIVKHNIHSTKLWSWLWNDSVSLLLPTATVTKLLGIQHFFSGHCQLPSSFIDLAIQIQSPHLNNHIGVALQVRTYSLLSVSELPGDKCTQLHSEGEFTETICYCILTLFSLISMLVLTVFHESFLLFPLRTKLFKRKMKTWYRLNNSLHAVNYIPAL